MRLNPEYTMNDIKILKVVDLTRRRPIVLETKQEDAIEENHERGCQLVANQLGKAIRLAFFSKLCDHANKMSLVIVYYPDKKIKGVAQIQIDVLSNHAAAGTPTPDEKCTLCILKKKMIRK